MNSPSVAIAFMKGKGNQKCATTANRDIILHFPSSSPWSGSVGWSEEPGAIHSTTTSESRDVLYGALTELEHLFHVVDQNDHVHGREPCLSLSFTVPSDEACVLQ